MTENRTTTEGSEQPASLPKIYDTKEAAQFLGISVRRVQALIKPSREGLKPQLPATRHGRDYIIFEKDLVDFKKLDRKSGRPGKESIEGEHSNGRTEVEH